MHNPDDAHGRPSEKDKARFERVWASHYAAVYAYARRRAPDEASARDVAAEAFLVAWRRLDTMPAKPRAWLLGTARKVLANQRRSGSRRDALHDRLAFEPEAPTADPELGELTEAFGRLRERDQEVLAMSVWDELPPREAAVVLGISPAVYSLRLHRAKQRLRKELGRTGHPSGEAPTTSGVLKGVRPKEARN